MLSDVASLIVDFIGAEDLKSLKLVGKDILNGPPGKYTSARADNAIPCPGSLSEFFSYIKVRNPNLYKLQDSIGNVKEITHLHLVFEYPHVLDTSNQHLHLQRECPLLRILTLEGPQKFCDQVLASLHQHSLRINVHVTKDPIMITKQGIYNAPENYHQDEFVIAH